MKESERQYNLCYDKYRDIENIDNSSKEKLIHLRDRIELKQLDWNNISYSNSYAYALGLEKEIMPASYLPGIIGAAIKGISIDKLKKLTIEEKLFLDLDALNIEYKKCLDSANSSLDPKKGFVIAMYEAVMNYYNFHFLRKDDRGIWSYKRQMGKVINKNDSDEYIYDLDHFRFECEDYLEFDYVGTYKLTLK